MSPKQWFALLAFYISYLFFGASVFYHFEQKLETERRQQALEERIEINELLADFIAPSNQSLQDEILEKVNDYCGKPVTNHTKDEFVDPYTWSFYHSFFFSFTVCSTVGYGNISPNNTFGRMFMIFYALVGIPVNGILFAYLGDFFGKTFIKLYRRYKTYKLSTDRNYVPRKINLIGQIMLYLIPGIVFFIFIPAILFTYFEGWEYTESIYYAFVTLTTIGFGDFVPTFQPHQGRTFGIYFTLYQMFIICWFILGVGYLVMVMGFLARGLRSKKIKRIEHHLAQNLRETQNKIWHGVRKDVGYIRKILNEVYFLKFKPIYRDHEYMNRKFQIPKSQSCPNLFADEEEDCNSLCEVGRQRAFSECDHSKVDLRGSVFALNRIQSDSNLTKIDKEKTFDISNSAVQPGELLAKVVVALGNFRPEERYDSRGNLGIHGFTDSQILASEQNYSNWSLAGSEKSYMTEPIQPAPRTFKYPRQRAISEIRIPIDDPSRNMNEWTWSGSNTQIKEIESMRSRAARPREPKESLYKASLKTKLRYDSESNADFPQELPTKMNATATNKSFINKLNPFRRKFSSSHMKRHSLGGQELDPQGYLNSNFKGRTRYVTPPHSYISKTMSGRNSEYSLPYNEEESNLLETTTIADLIRALEFVHTEANLPKASLHDLLKPKHKRKLGTDHLMPRIPSLLTLYPKSFDSSHTIGTGMDTNNGNRVARPRLFSCINSPTLFTASYNEFGGTVGDKNSPYTRKTSLHPINTNPPPYNDRKSPIIKTRRFSIRPSNLSAPPGQFHKMKRPIDTSAASVPDPSSVPRSSPFDKSRKQSMFSTTNINETRSIMANRKRFEQGVQPYKSRSLHSLSEIRDSNADESNK